MKIIESIIDVSCFTWFINLLFFYDKTKLFKISHIVLKVKV